MEITLSGSALVGVDPKFGAVPSGQLPSKVKLGRVRPKAQPMALKLSAYLKPGYTLPTLPVDWTTKAQAAISQMYLNDQYGCCVIADSFHRVGIWTGNESGNPVVGTDQEVLSTYRIWNPGNQDNGCVITDVLDYIKSTGITVAGQNHKIDGYVAVDWTNWDEVLVALYLFGAITLGINLPEAWTQNAVWDIPTGSGAQIAGGHDVPAVAKIVDNQVRIASWGRLYDVTQPAFTSKKWLEEAWAILSPDWYAKANVAPNLIDASTLAADLQKLSSGTIPDIGPTPGPGPGPGPNPPPPPAPTPAFSLNFPRAVRAERPFVARVNADIAAGKYDAYPSSTKFGNSGQFTIECGDATEE